VEIGRMTLAQAMRLREQAEEWPRCGQEWPQGRKEKQAEASLTATLGTDYTKEMCLSYLCLTTKADFYQKLAESNPQDPCPTCEQFGGWCGRAIHPSCGLFENHRPVAAQKKESKQ